MRPVTPAAARVREISDAAFALAQYRRQAPLSEADMARAGALAGELARLRPAVDAAAGHERAGLQVAFSEAFVDLDWVMSGMVTPMSLRMLVGAPEAP